MKSLLALLIPNTVIWHGEWGTYTHTHEYYVYRNVYVHKLLYSGTSLLRTLLNPNFSPYYRGVLNSEVT